MKDAAWKKEMENVPITSYIAVSSELANIKLVRLPSMCLTPGTADIPHKYRLGRRWSLTFIHLCDCTVNLGGAWLSGGD